jgi:glycogen synthase
MKEYAELNNNILIIGGYPPPYGGITIHIKRLFEFCKRINVKIRIVSQFSCSNKDENVVVLTGTKIIKLIKLIFIIFAFKGKVIHYHTAMFQNFIYGGLLLLFFSHRKKTIITIHSDLYEIPLKKSIKYRLHKYIFKKIDIIIALSEKQKLLLKNEYNIQDSKFFVIPSYINNSNLILNASDIIKSTVKKDKSEKSFIITSSGYMDKIYGYDLLLQAVKEMDEIKIYILTYNLIDKAYKKIFLDKIKNIKNVKYYENLSNDDFLYIIKNSDIFIRPSFADTYGMVIADAINFGVPAIASNVCERYNGTILFEVGNADDLKEKILDIKSNYKIKKKCIEEHINYDYAIDLLDLYKSIISENDNSLH